MAILLNGWILPIGGVASERVCTAVLLYKDISILPALTQMVQLVAVPGVVIIGVIEGIM